MRIRKTADKKPSPDAALQSAQRLIRLTSFVSPFWAARIADARFFSPLPVPLMKREQAIMDRAEMRHDLCCKRQRRIAVYSWGDGPAILLVHGWGARASRMCHLVSPLTAAGFRVLAFDAPAHGLSNGKQTSLAELQALLRELEQTHGPLHGLIAHSFGALACVYGLAHGLQVNKAVLISMPSRFAWLIEQYAARLQMSAAVTAAVKNRVQRRFAAFGDSFDAVAEHFSPVNYVSRIEAQVMMLHDADDKQVPFEESKHLAAVWPQAVFVPSRGLGHQRILHDPALIQRIVEFLEPQLAPSGAAAAV